MKVDWLEGTILDGRFKVVLDDLHDLLGDFQELPRGMLGYNHAAIVVGSGRVCWDDMRDDMGVHVSLPSTALGNLGVCPVSLLAIFLERFRMKFTRIDLAADDLKGILNLDTIDKSVRDMYFVSRWRKVKRVEDFENGKSQGLTFYFGSQSSDTQIRIYDKAAERRAAGENFVGHWVRVEIQSRDDRAHAVAEYIFKHPDSWQTWAAGYIKSYLDFKIPSGDSHKYRWVTAGWWDEFLGFVSKERLTFSVGVRTIEDVQEWCDRQLVPSLFALRTVLGEVKFSNLISGGASRLKPKHLAMIDLALSYQGVAS